MGFQPMNNNNGFNNNYNNNNGSEEKKKVNFKIGKIYGSDGLLEITTWNSNSGTKAILVIRQSVGKDPSSGNMVLEQKMVSDLPRFFMDFNRMRALLDTVGDKSVNEIMNFKMTGGQTSLSIQGMDNIIKLTISSTNEKLGSRTVTFESISTGMSNVPAAWENFIEFIKICYKKSLTAKLDKDEFGLAVEENESNE